MITKPKPGFRINPLHPLSRGLVGWWLFNEGGGPTAFDYSGNGNHGTLTNMDLTSVWKGSPRGGSLEFDGNNDLINAGSDSSLDSLTSGTLSAWINSDAARTAHQRIIHKDQVGINTGDASFFITASDHSTNPNEVAFFTQTTTNSLYSITKVTFGAWLHVVTTFDSSGKRIYINGVLVNSNAVSGQMTNASADLIIGSTEEVTDIFDGLIDDVRIYNRVLSTVEIQQLYANPYANIITTATQRTLMLAGFTVSVAGGKLVLLRRRRRAGR